MQRSSRPQDAPAPPARRVMVPNGIMSSWSVVGSPKGTLLTFLLQGGTSVRLRTCRPFARLTRNLEVTSTYIGTHGWCIGYPATAAVPVAARRSGLRPIMDAAPAPANPHLPGIGAHRGGRSGLTLLYKGKSAFDTLQAARSMPHCPVCPIANMLQLRDFAPSR